MHAFSLTCSILLTVALVGAAAMDFLHHPSIVATMDRLRLPKGFETIAGTVKVLAGLGLVVAMVAPHRSHPLGLVTAACLVAYFALAVAAHLRVKDPAKELVGATLLLAVAVALTASL